MRDDEGQDRAAADGAPNGTASGVPLGVAVDDRPAAKPSRAATNNREDRVRALMLIGGILAGVLLLVILGNTVLRPLITNQRQMTLERITAEQVELLATIAEQHYRTHGAMPSAVATLLDDERLETSDGRDLWGTAFALQTEYLESGDGMRLRVTSAGLDREFGTSDDLIAQRVLQVSAQDMTD